MQFLKQKIQTLGLKSQCFFFKEIFFFLSIQTSRNFEKICFKSVILTNFASFGEKFTKNLNITNMKKKSLLKAICSNLKFK
jgi:hypothetical protein